MQKLSVHLQNSGDAAGRVARMTARFIVSTEVWEERLQPQNRNPESQAIAAGQTVYVPAELQLDRWRSVQAGVLGMRIELEVEYESVNRECAWLYEASYRYDTGYRPQFVAHSEETTRLR